MTHPQSKDNLQQMQLDIIPHQEESEHPKHVQQPLALDALRIQPTAFAAMKNGITQRKDGRHLAGMALVASAFLVILIASQQQDDPAPERPANFTATALSPAPEIHRAFRDIAFNKPGEVLQLGLFRQLSGAETQQTRLASLGLLPHIEKRVSGTETKYAVMIGPLDPKAHEQTLTKLDSNNIAYFHARGPLDRLANGSNASQPNAHGS